MSTILAMLYVISKTILRIRVSYTLSWESQDKIFVFFSIFFSQGIMRHNSTYLAFVFFFCQLFSEETIFFMLQIYTSKTVGTIVAIK